MTDGMTAHYHREEQKRRDREEKKECRINLVLTPEIRQEIIKMIKEVLDERKN